MPPRLTLDEVHRLAAAVAADYPGITLDVAASDGEGESVELLLRRPSGANTDSHVMRVPRLDRAAFELELRKQLQAEIGKG
jgi:hypothetical protein